MITQFDNAALLSEAGTFTEGKWEYLADLLYDAFGGEYELRYIPSDKRSSADSKPYAIVHIPGNRSEYFMMFLGAQDNPEAAFARVIRSRSGNAIAEVDAAEAAQKAFQLRKELDEREALMDKARFLADFSRSGNYVNLGNGIKLDDKRRRI